MLTREQLESGLARFNGTDEYHAHWTKAFVMTDGVKWLADNAEAHWLIDALASYQPQCMKDPMLKDIQFWSLICNHEHPAEGTGRVSGTALLACERDEGDVAITQHIEWTTFPLPVIKLWVEHGVIMLPSER